MGLNDMRHFLMVKFEKCLWIETEVDDGVYTDRRLGQHSGQGQQVVRRCCVSFEPCF